MWGRGGGLGLGAVEEKDPKCLKGPKTTNATMAIAKNSSREVKRVHFRYILGAPGSLQEMESMGPGGEGPSRSPPRFLQSCRRGGGGVTGLAGDSGGVTGAGNNDSSAADPRYDPGARWTGILGTTRLKA